MKYLFLTDVDGTMLLRDVPIPGRVIDAAKKYCAKGGLLSLCTGRSLPAARETAHMLGVNAPSILYGGAAIYDFQAEAYLIAHPFQWDVMEAVKASLETAPGISMQVLTLDNVYVLRRNQRLNAKGVREENINPVCPPSAVSGQIMKIVMCCDDPQQLESCRPVFPPQFCNFTFASRTFVDVVAAGSGKGDALCTLSELTGIPYNHFFSAGDSMTDLPMMRLAKASFAPANAMDAVLREASCIVGDVHSGGMEQAFRIAADLLDTETEFPCNV